MLSVSSDVGAIGAYISVSLGKAKGDTERNTEGPTGPYGR